MAPLLADERFLQVGTSYLVNMLYVDSLEQDCFHMREGEGAHPLPEAGAWCASVFWILC